MSEILQNPRFRGRLKELIGDEEPFAWARRVGIPSSTFSRIWTEGTVPKAEHLIRIREATDVDLNWLIAGDVPLPSPAVDEEILFEVIGAVEDVLTDLGVSLSPGKKAKAILLFYNHYAQATTPQQLSSANDWLRFSLVDDSLVADETDRN